MLRFAKEISTLVHQVGTMEKIAMQTSSVEACAMAQKATGEAATHLYNVIVKEACAQHTGESLNHYVVSSFIMKLAHVLGKTCDRDVQLKLAAAIASDDVIDITMKNLTNPVELAKLAEMKVFGREYFTELLREVL